MSYHDLLYRYGYEQDSAEVRPYIYIQHPRKLSTPEQIMYRDKDAAENIRRLESIIADLKDYRQALAARYGELETMPYTRLLKLKRDPKWDGHKEFTVTITRTYADKTEIPELREVFTGKDRKKAFDRFAELKKQFPGIPCEMDIEKRQWEK